MKIPKAIISRKRKTYNSKTVIMPFENLNIAVGYILIYNVHVAVISALR